MNEPILELCKIIKNQKDPFEKARLISQLKKDHGIPLKEISQLISIKPSYICHILRLLKCPELIIDGYYSHVVSISHLFIISRLKDEGSMIKAYENVLNNSLTVIQTEELIRMMLFNVKSEGDFLHEEKKIQFSESMKKNNIVTKIQQTRSKGRIILEIQGSLSESSREITKIMDILSSKLTAAEKIEMKS